MAHGNQLLGQEGDDALGPAVKPGGYSLGQRCNLGNSHDREASLGVSHATAISPEVRAFLRQELALAEAHGEVTGSQASARYRCALSLR